MLALCIGSFAPDQQFFGTAERLFGQISISPPALADELESAPRYKLLAHQRG